jgi:N-acetyl-gamma-glutamyl-phosphate reductase
MKYKIYVDGQEGTTGLKINERLSGREDIEILKIDYDKRKDTEERRKLINEADVVFLCLPDVAAKEAVTLVSNDKTRIIDASTAHRIHPEWVYGIPELSKEQREKITVSKRVSVPGCHASGFNMALYPLVKEGIVPKDYPVTCHSITGYSGGGKKLIEQYEVTDQDKECLKSPNLYALGLNHKHIPEMQYIPGLTYAPIFTPIISDFYKGMLVTLPLFKRLLNKKVTSKEIHEFMSSYYKDQYFVEVMPYDPSSHLYNGFLNSIDCNNSNKLQIFTFESEDQILLVSRLDNLGKGSSGAAIQNMNVMLGLDEWVGLA